MPEINLLQGNVNTSGNSTATRIVFGVLGAIVLLAAAGSGAYFYEQNSSVNSQIASTVAAQAAAQSSVTADKNYKSFTTTQQDLSSLTTLFGSHVGWTSLIPKFSSATLKAVSFSNFKAAIGGGVDVSGSAPSFADLDKMMQGFQLPDFSPFISSVSLVSIGLAHSSAGNSVSFSVHVNVNPATLKFANQ
jgi:hypothetical protein